MVRLFNFSLLSVVVVLLLNGCSSDSILAYHLEPPGMTGTLYFNSAAIDGVVRMDITGNPFNVGKASLDTLVTSKFEGAYLGNPARFSTTSPPEYDSNTRIVIFFQPARGVTQSTICDLQRLPNPSTITASSDRLEIKAALCIRKRNYSFTRVTGPMPPALDSPEMVSFIKTTARTVIPEREKGSREGCSILPC